MNEPTPVIIDTDPGIDDVVALALAAQSPELDIAAVVTTYGNAGLAETTQNAKHLLELVGRGDIPVHAGSDRPLERELVTAPETHGPKGVGYAESGTAPPTAPDPLILLNLLRARSSPVVLVTLGPLTNLARAILTDRQLVETKVSGHIGMFGNLHEMGNTNRWADFNCWCDPEAAAIVLESNLHTEMVGLDVTRKMTISADEVTALEGSDDDVVRWLASALRFYVEFHRSQERLDGCVVNDVLPIGELLRPGLLGFEARLLTVDRSQSEHRGHTKIDSSGLEVKVATAVDITGMRELLDRALGSGWIRNFGEDE